MKTPKKKLGEKIPKLFGDDDDDSQSKMCNTCLRKIRGEKYIQCTLCHGMIQCVECFSVGAEKHVHLRDHPFVIVGPNYPTIFSHNWMIDEEMKLLEAIILWGLGNWSEVSAMIKGKTELECESHYFNSYFESSLSPKPDFLARRDKIRSITEIGAYEPCESLPSDGNEANLKDKGKKERTTPGEISGFMPYRCEFEYDFCEDAESIIAGLCFDDIYTINDEEISLPFEKKMDLLLSYHNIVKERDTKTTFIKEWDMQSGNFDGFGYNSEKNSILLGIIPYLSRDETNRLLEIIDINNSLQSVIDQCIFWNDLGISDEQDGFLVDRIDHLLKENGELDEKDINEWNKLIDKRLSLPQQTLIGSILSSEESLLCAENSMDIHYYMAIKDMIIREFTVRGSLSPTISADIDPKNTKFISKVIELYKAKGWAC